MYFTVRTCDSLTGYNNVSPPRHKVSARVRIMSSLLRHLLLSLFLCRPICLSLAYSIYRVVSHLSSAHTEDAFTVECGDRKRCLRDESELLMDGQISAHTRLVLLLLLLTTAADVAVQTKTGWRPMQGCTKSG